MMRPTPPAVGGPPARRLVALHGEVCRILHLGDHSVGRPRPNGSSISCGAAGKHLTELFDDKRRVGRRHGPRVSQWQPTGDDEQVLALTISLKLSARAVKGEAIGFDEYLCRGPGQVEIKNMVAHRDGKLAMGRNDRTVANSVIDDHLEQTLGCVQLIAMPIDRASQCVDAPTSNHGCGQVPVESADGCSSGGQRTTDGIIEGELVDS